MSALVLGLAGMGGRGNEPKSMDAKVREDCEDCEFGDAGAEEGARPDRTYGYMRRMTTS
jgi:hypothetical protein